MITDVGGVRAGHWTDERAATGCTVVLFPDGTVASGEVRGGAPGTREFDLLMPGRLVARLDAVVLTGGSAFGLSACDGVVRWLAERGAGFPTSAGPVPIVAGMVLYDLGVGDPSVRPGPEEGYAACDAAATAGGDSGGLALGRVGAGTGATYAKWRGRDHAKPGGVGSATVRSGAASLVVSALVAVNAVGDLRPPHGSPVALDPPPAAPAGNAFEATTIGVVATNARLDKLACHLVAQSAHDGLARALEPAHTLGDGDAFVAAATGTLAPDADADVDIPLDHVRALAAHAVELAIVDAVRPR